MGRETIANSSNAGKVATCNKKLFMCVNYPLHNPAIGISKKIKSQIENFEKLGFEVTYSAYTNNSVVIRKGETVVSEIRYPAFIPSKLYSVIRKFYWLKEVKKYLESSTIRYDIGFIRWGAIDKSFLNALETLDTSCDKIIMDCHGYHKNYKGHTLKGLYIEKTTKRNSYKLHKYIDICLTETKDKEVFGINAIPIDTGIDVDKYQPHKYAGSQDEIHMISVANECPYHGYDRIIKEIARCKNDNVFLHLVGKMSKKTQKLVNKLRLENKVYFHGYKTGKELNDIYNKCNIGVGPLAPHRTGGKEGTGIKTKEYFAIGLPYFYAGQELLVPNSYPYVLKFESDDTVIDIAKVVQFYNHIKDDHTMQEQMRSFARENFSWEKTFRKALHAVKMENF
ncbi:glycosyltransferase [Candidatus Saccharibacteria bacterium]|nr:glycosyltransferase [Candidatus Saccharibacteria bacterium]